MTPQSDETKIELIGKDIEYIKRDISVISGSIKELSGMYITQKDFIDFKTENENRLIKLESKRVWWSVLTPTVVSLFSVILTFLVMFYIQNVKL